MKKIVSVSTLILFSLVLLFGAVACGGSSQGEKEAVKMMEKYTKKLNDLTKQVKDLKTADDVQKFATMPMTVMAGMFKEMQDLTKKYPELKKNSSIKNSDAFKAFEKAGKDFKAALEAKKKELKK